MAYFYRTDLSEYTETEYPKTVKIRSKKELDDYYCSNKNTYQFHTGFYGEPGMAEDVFSESSLCNSDKFFSSNFLLFIILEEGSGSNRHRVESVSSDNGTLSVSITRVLPEIGTADMAQWHIVLSLDKSLSEMDVVVRLSDSSSAAHHV